MAERPEIKTLPVETIEYENCNNGCDVIGRDFVPCNQVKALESYTDSLEVRLKKAEELLEFFVSNHDKITMKESLSSFAKVAKQFLKDGKS